MNIRNVKRVLRWDTQIHETHRMNLAHAESPPSRLCSDNQTYPHVS